MLNASDTAEKSQETEAQQRHREFREQREQDTGISEAHRDTASTIIGRAQKIRAADHTLTEQAALVIALLEEHGG